MLGNLVRNHLGILTFVLLFGCIHSKQTLKVTSLPNFDKTATEHILFLTFEIKRNTNSETVRLTNSIVATGKIKNLMPFVRSDRRIRLVRYGKNDKILGETEFEHPLYRPVELFGIDGVISTQAGNLKTGQLSVRIQYDIDLKRIELVSIEAEKKASVIYRLKLLP